MAPPRKPRASAPEKPASAVKGTRPDLTPTDDPEVFRNAFGMAVDKHGIALSFRKAKQHEDAMVTEVLGHPVSTPAQYLKSLALDPRVPTAVRMDAAKAAAPYTDRKMPQALDGGVDPNTGAAMRLFPASMYEGLSDEAIQQIKAIFAKEA